MDGVPVVQMIPFFLGNRRPYLHAVGTVIWLRGAIQGPWLLHLPNEHRLHGRLGMEVDETFEIVLFTASPATSLLPPSVPIYMFMTNSRHFGPVRAHDDGSRGSEVRSETRSGAARVTANVVTRLFR